MEVGCGVITEVLAGSISPSSGVGAMTTSLKTFTTAIAPVS
jgi:hypothetical protein